MATTRDFFSIQGVRETYAEVKRMYERFDKLDNIQLIEDDHGHGYTRKLREAMYAFFQKHLDNPGNSAEKDVEPLTAEDMQVTSTGQVATSLGGETVFSLNQKEAEKKFSQLQLSREDLSTHLPEALESAKEFSGYQDPEQVEEPVFTGRIQRSGYVVEKYFVEGEGDYVIPYLLMVPEEANGKGVVYLHPSGKAVEASTGGEIERLVRRGFTVLAPDLVGVGEMGPGDLRGDAYIDGVSYNLWFTSVLIGRSIVGVQAGDMVRLTRLLQSEHETSEVYGVARREMAPVLLHAAAFETSISRIGLIEPYSSYRSIVTNRFYESDFVYSIVAGALNMYDLPDLAASLAPRRLAIIGVTSGGRDVSDAESIFEDMAVIEAAYDQWNADGKLTITVQSARDSCYSTLMEWLR